MRKSTNFNLNLVEGNDLVNPLVQDVPNYEAIDEQMYKNECNSIGIATELKSGTVHALTRTIPDAPMFRFQATSNFTAGDTFTVDGIQVSALTPSGETLASGCYIIGSEVLCVLRETLLTVYVSGGTVTTAQDSEKLGGQLPEYYGTAENVASALETAQSANRLTLALQEDLEESKTYFSDETPIGRWIDGKTIYRKIIQKDIPANSNPQFVDITSLNISEVLSIEAVTIASNGYVHSGTYSPFFSITINNNSYIDLLKTSTATGNARIIIEYTKSL